MVNKLVINKIYKAYTHRASLPNQQLISGKVNGKFPTLLSSPSRTCILSGKSIGSIRQEQPLQCYYSCQCHGVKEVQTRLGSNRPAADMERSGDDFFWRNS